MDSWEQKKSKVFQTIIDIYISKTGYEEFGNYCALREKGLRKEALLAITKFIENTKKYSDDEQKKITNHLLDMAYAHQEFHQLIPHPLKQYFLIVLEAWSKEENQNHIPFRWIGYLDRKGLPTTPALEMALAIEPHDQVSIELLIEHKLDSLWFMTHHMSESIFLGTLENANIDLERLTRLVDVIAETEQKTESARAVNYYRKLIQAWANYKSAKSTQSFPEWCFANGLQFSFTKIYYYNKPSS